MDVGAVGEVADLPERDVWRHCPSTLVPQLHLWRTDASRRIERLWRSRVSTSRSINGRMGWESRDWAKWSDRERRDHLDSRPTATVGECHDRTRVAVWSALAAMVIALGGGGWFANAWIDGGGSVPDGAVTGTWTGAGPHVIYGWSHVPPRGSTDLDPSHVGTRMGGVDVLCVTRVNVGAGRWVCDSYAIINPGDTLVEMPWSSAMTEVPCNAHPVPCPNVVPTSRPISVAPPAGLNPRRARPAMRRTGR